DGALGAFLAQAFQRERADGSRKAATPEVGVRADGLEFADAVLRVEPGEAVRGDPAVRCDGDAVEVGAIRPRAPDVAVAFDGHARRRERAAVRLDSRLDVLVADRAELEAVGEM